MMKVQAAIFVALFSLLLVTESEGQRRKAGECENLVPGLLRMSKGVDLSQLDLFHNYAESSVDGFVRPVISFTCKRKRSHTIDNISYQIPDQIEMIEKIPGGTDQSMSKLVKTTSELRHEMESQVGLGSSGTKGSFTGSATYKTMTESLVKSRKFVAVKTTTVSKTRANFEPSAVIGNSSMTPHLRTAIDKLPEKFNSQTVGPYMLLFKIFGTHFFQTASFGGMFSSIFQIDRSLTKKMTEKEIGVEVNAKFLEILSASGKVVDKDHKVDQRFEEASTHINRYNGGEAELLDTKNDYSGWSKTVAANPWIMSGILQPITRLLPDDEPKKAEIEKAYETYMEKAFLSELLQVTTDYVTSPAFKNQKTLIEIKKKIEDKLANDPIPDPSFSKEMEQKLTDYVVTPEWFKESEFCFRRDSTTGDNAARCLKIGDEGSFHQTRYLCDGWAVPGLQFIPWLEIFAGYQVKCFPFDLTIKPATDAGARILENSKIRFVFEVDTYPADGVDVQMYTATMKMDTSPDAETPGWLRLVRLGVRTWDKDEKLIKDKTAILDEPLVSDGAQVGGVANVYWTKERSAWKAGLWYLLPSDEY